MAVVFEEASISFFRVNKCGYYKWSSEEAEFGSLEDTMSQLAAWGGDVELAQTKLADPKPDSEQLPVYLFGIKKDKDSWVFATWNEVPSHEAGIASVKLDSKVGAPQVKLNEIEKNTIPGYATYFWVIPSKNILATIRFGRPISGQAAMTGYLQRFLSQYTSYAVWSEVGVKDAKVLGYSDDPDGELKKVRPAFQTSAYMKSGPRDYILKNWSSITKVVRRGHITTTKPLDRATFQGFMQWIRSDSKNKTAVRQSAYLELQYSPEYDELRKMIDAEESDPDTFGWDDLGFGMKGEGSTIRWLSRARAAGVFNLQIDRKDEETITLNSLMQALNDNRSDILKTLK